MKHTNKAPELGNETPAQETANQETPVTETTEAPAKAEIAPVITSVGAFSFKNRALAGYSRRIAELGADISAKNVEIAKILGHVLDEKCYVEDGFKSVAEYAEEVFGIKKQSAYQMANVGARFFNSEDETAKKVSALVPPSNLAELQNVPMEEIKKALDSGIISESSTQKSLREFAKSTKEPKITVETMYSGSVKSVIGSTVKNEPFAKVVLDSQLESVASGFGFSKELWKPYGKNSKVAITESGDIFVVTFEKYVEPKPAKVSKPVSGGKKFTVDELMAMLEEAKAEEAKAKEEASE